VAYYLFDSYFKDQRHTRRWLLQRENQKQSLPMRLQAYERLALLLERISPAKLIVRVAPFSKNKMEYQNLLIQHIEQEFEHNLSQQIYVTDECWQMLVTAKNATVQHIRKTTLDDNITNADELREKILSSQLSGESASGLALSFLKNEVTDMLG
jgi:hypothetical protein